MAGRIPARLSPKEGRKFGITVGAAFLVLTSITWWRDHITAAQILGSVGGLLLIAGIVVPGKLGPVYHAWMGLAHAISRITTPIFMAIVFFFVIGPIGIVMRLIGRNPLIHKPNRGSYWIARAARERPNAMEHQF